ncbi:hypothetical protein [Sessilibacter corallicola]|uniref:hypothetical protein n=1 Tax=Sessilibacter corallicola TaxID=2904075 RepID=UPI001E3584CE|nr:hypothetical protein [Sessilibacter corallicola]MCE2029822.1 hypothetical protein [Sessilibacter corallicola]
MKQEFEYITEIKERWPENWEDPEPTKETISLIDEAVKAYPNSEKLWVMRGDLYLLINYEDGTPIEESLHYYKKRGLRGTHYALLRVPFSKALCALVGF